MNLDISTPLVMTHHWWVNNIENKRKTSHTRRKDVKFHWSTLNEILKIECKWNMPPSMTFWATSQYPAYNWETPCASFTWFISEMAHLLIHKNSQMAHYSLRSTSSIQLLFELKCISARFAGAIFRESHVGTITKSSYVHKIMLR